MTALAAVLLAAHSAPSPARAEPVPLTWQWPAELRLSVSAHTRAEVTQGETSRVLEVTLPLRMVARTVDDGTQVTFAGDEPAAVMSQLGLGKVDTAEGITEAVVLTLAYATPDFRVDGSGRFAGLLEPDAALDAFFAGVSAHVGVPGVGSRSLRQLARARMEQRATDLWGALVGTWRGTALEPGKTYPGKEPMGVAGAPNAGLDLRYTLRAGVACAPGAPATCVALTVDKHPDAAVLASMRAKSGKGAEATESATVTADPATLIPFELVVSRSTTLERQLPDGVVRTDHEASTERLAFTR